MRDRQYVWEWCEDRYGTYALGEVTDPVGTERDTRVARGGGWSDQAQLVRAAKRVALEHGTQRDVGVPSGDRVVSG